MHKAVTRHTLGLLVGRNEQARSAAKKQQGKAGATRWSANIGLVEGYQLSFIMYQQALLMAILLAVDVDIVGVYGME